MFEDNSKKIFQATSSTNSGFYNSEYSKHIPNKLNIPIYPQHSSLFLSKFPHISAAVSQCSDNEILKIVRSKVDEVNKVMNGNKYCLQKMGEMEQIHRILQNTHDQIKQLKDNNEIIHDKIKEEFMNGIAKIEKELLDIQKEWKLYKQKSDQELSEGIQILKEQQRINEATINKQSRQVYGTIRDRLYQLAKEIKLFKRQKTTSKAKTLQTLQNIRSKYLRVLKDEENKRNQLDKTIYNLLEGTCNRAEKALRRTVL